MPKVHVVLVVGVHIVGNLRKRLVDVFDIIIGFNGQHRIRV